MALIGEGHPPTGYRVAQPQPQLVHQSPEHVKEQTKSNARRMNIASGCPVHPTLGRKTVLV